MKKVYICHPYTGNKEENVRRYLKCVALAMKMDICVISWVHNHLTDLYGLTNESYDWYMAQDLELLSLADEVWTIEPHSHSRGVQIEIQKAKELEIPIREVSYKSGKLYLWEIQR